MRRPTTDRKAGPSRIVTFPSADDGHRNRPRSNRFENRHKPLPSLYGLSRNPLAELCCRKLKELSDRLEQIHALGKGVERKSGPEKQKITRLRRSRHCDRSLAWPDLRSRRSFLSKPLFSEPLSIIIGKYREVDFLEFRIDGRRPEPFESRVQTARRVPHHGSPRT
jgi:hypothetical protein